MGAEAAAETAAGAIEAIEEMKAIETIEATGAIKAMEATKVAEVENGAGDEELSPYLVQSKA